MPVSAGFITFGETVASGVPFGVPLLPFLCSSLSRISNPNTTFTGTDLPLTNDDICPGSYVERLISHLVNYRDLKTAPFGHLRGALTSLTTVG